MKQLKLSLLAVALFAAGGAAGASLRNAGLDAWIANELTPFVREQMENHPRFRGESLRFVVLRDGNPQATSNSLALGVRDRLRDSVADVPGIRIAWQPDNPHYLRNSGPAGVDCTRTEVHYLIGIEMKLIDQGTLAVELKALDVEDRSVVSGFSKNWQVAISKRQYLEFRRVEADLTFRGEREVPYDESQSDLLATHLAHDLGCSLLRQTGTEYVIAATSGTARSDPVDGIVELVSNNLAQYSSLQFASSDESANSIIAGKAHRIDADLYQYWITVQPKDADPEIKALSASVYVRLPEKFAAAEIFPASPDPVFRNNRGFLESLRIVELQQSTACLSWRISGTADRFRRSYLDNGDCFALTVRSADDAVVFFLHHQLNHGLVRLADASCLQSATARVVKARQLAQFALPPDFLSSAAWSAADDWQPDPDRDTFYAVATSESKAARELSRHIRQLPNRCSASVRPGLEGIGLRRWLDELARIIDHWGPAIDWQTIRVKNIY